MSAHPTFHDPGEGSGPAPGPTSPVAVVADTGCGLPFARARSLGVSLVPFLLVLEGRRLRDGVDVTAEEFFTSLDSYDPLPTTASPPPAAFRDAYEAAWAQGRDVLVLTCSAKLSAAHSAARLAAGDPAGRIEVLDTGLASAAEALTITAAARASAAGGGLAEVSAAAHDAAARMRLLGTIETFHYLKRSGRVNGVAAFAAEALRIKPIFAMRAGEIGGFARPRGREEALHRIVAEVESEADHRRDAGVPGRLHVAAMHAVCADDARRLLDGVAHFDPVEVETTEFTPVMGVHTGPGTCGLAWWWEP